jgi:hypothetical protein
VALARAKARVIGKFYDQALPNIVAQQTAQGRHLILVDMYSAFTQNPNYKTALLGEELHPNEAGCARVVEVWHDAIEAFLR